MGPPRIGKMRTGLTKVVNHLLCPYDIKIHKNGPKNPLAPVGHHVSEFPGGPILTWMDPMSRDLVNLMLERSHLLLLR